MTLALDTAEEPAPLVSIVILNWRGWRDTLDCLDSLLELSYPRYSVVVVDNGSGDESLSKIEDWARSRDIPLRTYRLPCGEESPLLVAGQEKRETGFQSLELIASAENAGFCVGNNRGMAHAVDVGAEFLLVLNNDTICEAGFLELLVEAAQQDPSAGLLCPLICYADSRDTIWWGGGKFNAMLSPTYSYQGESRSVLAGRDPQISDWATGCAMFMPAEVFEQFRGFDPRYFIWCDEWDLSLRVRNSGLCVKVVPGALIYHKVGQSLGFISPLTFYYGMRNMLVLRKKHLPLLRWFCAYLATVPWKFFQAIRLTLRYRERLYLLAYWDVACSINGRDGGIWKRQDCWAKPPQGT